VALRSFPYIGFAELALSADRLARAGLPISIFTRHGFVRGNGIFSVQIEERTSLRVSRRPSLQNKSVDAKNRALFPRLIEPPHGTEHQQFRPIRKSNTANSLQHSGVVLVSSGQPRLERRMQTCKSCSDLHGRPASTQLCEMALLGVGELCGVPAVEHYRCVACGSSFSRVLIGASCDCIWRFLDCRGAKEDRSGSSASRAEGFQPRKAGGAA
jgi:hypothetical protein